MGASECVASCRGCLDGGLPPRAPATTPELCSRDPAWQARIVVCDYRRIVVTNDDNDDDLRRDSLLLCCRNSRDRPQVWPCWEQADQFWRQSKIQSSPPQPSPIHSLVEVPFEACSMAH